MTFLVAGLMRGLGLASLAAVIGALVLEQVILPARVPELAVARTRLCRWITACLVVLLLITLADLVVRTQTMSRGSLVVAIAAVPDVVARTHLGTIFTVRAVGVALALVLSISRVSALRRVCLLVAGGVALTTSLTSHAADWGDATLSVGIDWAHAVAASAWTGGLIALALVVFRGPPAWSPTSVAILAQRFSRLAGACLLVVVLTGSYNAWTQLGAPSRLWTTAYGGALIVKVLIVAALAWLGAINRYVVVPRLNPRAAAKGVGARFIRLARLVIVGASGTSGRATAPSRLAAYVTGEAMIALVVFACTAALGEVTPGRHVSFERKLTTHVPPVQPRPGSGMSGGAVTPPPGDAARGRSAFVKLKCFSCHAVRGEGFPAPSQPGPDLSDIGSRHPGYLVESVMNPNAMIVDGPGYTDAQGLSIMPDYRHQLTVAELIDLIAYLKGRTR